MTEQDSAQFFLIYYGQFQGFTKSTLLSVYPEKGPQSTLEKRPGQHATRSGNKVCFNRDERMALEHITLTLHTTNHMDRHPHNTLQRDVTLYDRFLDVTSKSADIGNFKKTLTLNIISVTNTAFLWDKQDQI